MSQTVTYALAPREHSMPWTLMHDRLFNPISGTNGQDAWEKDAIFLDIAAISESVRQKVKNYANHPDAQKWLVSLTVQ